MDDPPEMPAGRVRQGMALVRCLLCDHEVPPRTSSCPDCGFPLRAATELEPDESASTGVARTGRGFSIALVVSGSAIALGSLLPSSIVYGGLFGTVNLERLDDDASLFMAIGAILTLIGVVTATHGPTRLGGVAALCIAATTTMIWYLDLTETLEAIDMVNSPLEPFARGGMGIGSWVLAIGLWVGFVGAGGIASRSVHSVS